MKMPNMRLRTIFVLIFVKISFSQKINFEIRKCCGEKERLDSQAKKCIHFDDETFSNDSLRILATIVIGTLGLQNELQLYNLSVRYNTLTDTQLDVTESALFDSEFANNINNFENRVSTTFIDERRSCFDVSTNRNRTHVLLFSVKLKPLHKCCGKGNRLNSSSLRCESRPGQVQSEIDEEIIFPEKNTEDYNWVPRMFSKTVIKVKYDFMNYSFNYNFKKYFNVYKWNTVARDEKDVFWMMYNTNPRNPPIIIMKKLNASAKVTEGVTEIYCFEEVSEGPLAPRALLAVVYNVQKCCGKGMQYSKDFATCEQRPNQPEEFDVLTDVVDWQTNPDAAFWLPTSLRSQSNLSVRYWHNKLFPIATAYVYNENLWTISRSDGIPEVALNVTILSGESFVFKTLNFCFEYIADTMAVLVLKMDFLQDSVMKCCYPGEIISRNGYCMKYNGLDWTPGSSEGRDQFNRSIIPKENINYPLRTQCESFSTQAIDTPRAIQHFGGKHKDEGRWETVFYCNDFQLTPDGVKEVVGSCSNRPTARVYEGVRPLAVVSAILLAAAAFTTVIQGETRRSAHGRALACHALCLCLADALQVAWFFQTPGRVDPNCDSYAYCIYFFMTAANFWLTSITVNMARGFRQPLGALANQKGDGVVWKRFGFMSLFAWGGSMTLSIIAISVHQHKKNVVELGFITPSFFETRTCTFENIFYSLYYLLSAEESAGGRLGALLYYYVPMAILVLTNGICVVLTVRTVRSLQRDKAFLQRDTTNPKQSMDNVLLYAKLLLTTGIIELVLEAVAWAIGGRRRTHNLTINWNDSIERSYIFTIISTLIDFARAATVFWLCAGKQWRGVGAACGKAKERLVNVFTGHKNRDEGIELPTRK